MTLRVIIGFFITIAVTVKLYPHSEVLQQEGGLFEISIDRPFLDEV